MNSRVISRVIILGVLAILGILVLQGFWIYQSWSQESKEFHERVTIALREVATKLTQYNNGTLPVNDLIIRKAPNYYVVNMEDVIDANVLEHYLYSTFTEHAILLDFEYAVFDCHTREMVYGNYCNVVKDPEDIVSQRGALLPRYDEFTYYFAVRFPSRQNYLFKEMNRIWLVTAILTITLLFFAYAIYVIISQKKWAEMQKDFINNMTHEFKTPISSIKLSSDVIRKAPVIQNDEKLKTYVGIIQDQNQRLNRQVEQVLSMAKLENDQFQLQKEEVKVQSILSELKQAHQFRIESQNGQFTLICEPKDIVIEADRSHFFNLLNNLVDNAVKYSDKEPVITVEIRAVEEGVSIEVTDQGKGIEPQHLGKITEKFYRIPQGNIHDVKGFGLGLYYVKNICKAHKWSFEISSKKGIGTKCLIFIPT